jgi:PIN domain nuclease of toxin-antitoxin system
MNLLLDTCTFIWLTSDPSKISSTALAAIRDPANSCALSSVSIWEFSVLIALRRAHLQQPLKQFIEEYRSQHAISPLPFGEQAALLNESLPWHHKDPFDRMLICQTMADSLIIVTPDALIAKYPVSVLW